MSYCDSIREVQHLWHSIARGHSEETAEEKLREIREMAIEIVDVDWNLTRGAASFKAKGRLAYADCFAAALARERKAELVTCDREFRQLENMVKVLWIN